SLAWLGRRQLLDVSGQVSCGDLSVATLDGLEQRVVDEDVLVLRLHHVVPLGAQARHMTVDVHRHLVLDALQHGVDHDERSGPADSSTVVTMKCWVGLTVTGLDPAHEHEQRRRVVGHSVVGPGRELELAHLALL
ncbi:hypothetical protein EGW08_016877, partial [Elysia chlorotica]